MAQFQSPAEMITLRKYLSILIVLCIGGILSVSAYTAIRQAEVQNIEFEFIDTAKDQMGAIAQTIEQHQHTVKILANFYQASPTVIEDSIFQTFAKPLLEQQAGLYALYWVSFADNSPKATTSITQLVNKPALAGLQKTFDFNALINTTDLAQQFAMHPYWVSEWTLIHPETQQMGIHFLYPVYDAAIAQQPAQLRGLVGGILVLDDLLQAVASHVSHHHIDVFIYDDSAPNLQLIGADYANSASAFSTPNKARTHLAESWFQTNKTITLANRTWLISCAAVPNYFGLNTSHLPILILVGGIIFMLLILAYLLMFIGRTSALQREIVHRQSVMEELQRKEEELATFAHSAPVMLWMTDELGQCVLLNQTWLDFTGHVEHEAFAQKWTNSIHPDDLDQCSEVYIDVFFNKHQDFHMVYRVLRHDGHYRWIAETGIARFNEQAVFLGFVGACVDITEQKQAEEAVHESQRQLATLMSNLPGMAYRCHYQDKMQMAFVSDGGEELTGYTPSEFTKQTICWFDIVHPEDKMQLRAVLQNALDNQYAYQTSYRIFTAEGAEKWVWEQGQFLPNPLTQVPILEGFITDITEQKRAEAAMDHARQLAESANRSKSQFLANMSHELRTPLNAILGYSEILQEEAEDAGFHEFLPDLNKIRGAGQHLLGLINDILDISKIEAGKMDIYAETFNLHNILIELAETVQPALQKRGNIIRLQISDTIAEVHTDLVKTRQILLNLLSNAAKFTEDGIITLRAEQVATAQGEQVLIRVKDTGIGISPTQQENLFEAFTQADASTTRKYGGTGLGLAISYQFAQMLRGNLWVESEPDKGSTFIVQLPVQLDTESVISAPASLDNEPPQALFDEGSTILVIDDDADVQNVLREYLIRMGYHVTVAADGKTGLQLARQLQPDAITLDIMMPDMDGWSVLSALKADTQLSEIPVIILSMLDDQRQGYSLGATDYLTKPVSREQLSSVLHKYQAHRPNSGVLVVEDDSATRDMVMKILHKAGCQVIGAQNGVQALEMLAKQSPDLILLDLMMPEMDGFEFVYQLRNHPEWVTIPVVVLTAKDLSQADLSRLHGRVQTIFQKGAYDTAELLEEVHKLLNIEQIRRRQQPAEQLA